MYHSRAGLAAVPGRTPVLFRNRCCHRRDRIAGSNQWLGASLLLRSATGCTRPEFGRNHFGICYILNSNEGTPAIHQSGFRPSSRPWYSLCQVPSLSSCRPRIRSGWLEADSQKQQYLDTFVLNAPQVLQLFLAQIALCISGCSLVRPVVGS